MISGRHLINLPLSHQSVYQILPLNETTFFLHFPFLYRKNINEHFQMFWKHFSFFYICWRGRECGLILRHNSSDVIKISTFGWFKMEKEIEYNRIEYISHLYYLQCWSWRGGLLPLQGANPWYKYSNNIRYGGGEVA